MTLENTKGAEVLTALFETVMERKKEPKEGSYTNYLLDNGLDKILKKVGEEAAETIIAAKNPGNEELILEISDLLYHLTVLLAERDTSWEDIFAELLRREQKEGNLKEKKHPEKISEY